MEMMICSSGKYLITQAPFDLELPLGFSSINWDKKRKSGKLLSSKENETDSASVYPLPFVLFLSLSSFLEDGHDRRFSLSMKGQSGSEERRFVGCWWFSDSHPAIPPTLKWQPMGLFVSLLIAEHSPNWLYSQASQDGYSLALCISPVQPVSASLIWLSSPLNYALN